MEVNQDEILPLTEETPVKIFFKQECIPVGCVTSNAVAVWGGVCPGGCMPGGVCLGGVSAGGVYWGDVCPEGCQPRSGGVHLPPINRILDTHLRKHYLSATSFADGKSYI